MTNALNWIQSIFWKRADRANQAVPAEAPQPVKLSRILVASARCRGGTASEQLLVQEMSPASLVFVTQGDFCEGDELEVEMLLNTLGRVKLLATLLWVRPSAGVTFRGELRLTPDAEQRQLLEHFLERQARGHR